MKRIITVCILCLVTGLSYATRVYVNINATGANNGTSWQNAYIHLDSAVRLNQLIDTVWVANGLYKNAAGYNAQHNAKIFGGFNGTETSLSQRNWATFQTILDADIGVPGVNTDNLPGLIGFDISNIVQDCVLDGFKLVNAYSTFSSHNSFAWNGFAAVGIGSAGANSNIYNIQTHHIVIQNCWFTNNHAYNGGGAINCFGDGGGDVIVNNCRFDNNTSTGNGGAIYNSPYDYGYSTLGTPGTYKLTVTNCSFRGNRAGGSGGAIWAGCSSLKVASCSFVGDSAARGGAIADSGNAQLSVWSCLFAGNKAAGPGGAHYSLTPPATGSLYRSHAFYHCTFAQNVSLGSSNDAYTLWLRGSSDTLRNSILWGNQPGTGTIDIDTGVSGLYLRSNLIQGGASLPSATHTFSFSPGFISPGAISSVPFPLTLPYSYHLNAFSPAIDTAQILSYPSYATRDLDSLPRFAGSLPDLGAYEWKSCSLSAAGITIAASGPDTFCAPGYVTYTASSGLGTTSFSWNSGPVVKGTSSYTASATGQVLLVSIDSGGCRSAARRNVDAVAAPSPLITISGNTLSVPAVYASYQWYLGGVAIAGATSAAYNPATNGVYSVQVTTTAGNCPGSSAAYNLRNLSAGGGGASYSYSSSMHLLKVYPNPAGEVLHIEGGGEGEGAAATLSTIAGQVVRSTSLKTGTASIDMHGLSAGIYLITITAPDGERTVKRISKL